jgi:type VI secretion system protein ImpI
MLALRIENETTLPDGGPLSITVQGTRGIDIGRDQYLDWTLPDPSRFISGKHCEIRWHDGAYWLHDVSTNGTFLDGTDGRLKAPHRLRDGDRFSIGHYIIVASVSAAAGAQASAATSDATPAYDALWDPVGEAAAPIDPRQLKDARDLQPVKPDFLDWAIDVPPSHISSSAPPPSASPQPRPRDNRPPLPAADDDASWAQGPRREVPPEPKPAVSPTPSPRRPVWVSSEPNGAWAPSPSAPAPAQMTAAARGADAFAPAPMAPAATADLLRAIARGAGLPDDAFAARDGAQFAEELGQLLRLVSENMKQLLDARQQAKRLARSTNQTTIQALENNPLKFAPTAEDAMRIMFGPPTRSYLDARSALAQGFDDVKAHQLRTFAAMQHALRQLMDEFNPATIERTSGADRGIAGVVGSRKARLWDGYVARWQAHTGSHQDGLLNAFMNYFAEFYDRDGNRL